MTVGGRERKKKREVGRGEIERNRTNFLGKKVESSVFNKTAALGRKDPNILTVMSLAGFLMLVYQISPHFANHEAPRGIFQIFQKSPKTTLPTRQLPVQQTKGSVCWRLQLLPGGVAEDTGTDFTASSPKAAETFH